MKSLFSNLIIRVQCNVTPWKLFFKLQCIELSIHHLTTLYTQTQNTHWLNYEELTSIFKRQTIYDLQIESHDNEYFLYNIKTKLDHIKLSPYGLELIFSPYRSNQNFNDILNELTIQ